MTEAIATEPSETQPERPRENNPVKVRPALEALLFSCPRPISEKDLADVLEATRGAVREALEMLRGEAEQPQRAIRLESVAGGWRYVTRPEFDSLLRKFHEVTERSRLSLAALETLAIIAYRQPITLPEIQEIRDVNSAAVVRTLFEKGLITTAGRKPVVGTPFLYRTTREFLIRFGLKQLEELPKPEELEEDLSATVSDSQAAQPLPAPFVSTLSDREDDDEDEDEDDNA
ncbi:MAG TPA: SMC-Scp complex subunit ScpB [Thermoanaerobaculia bacterium]|nr:SMC-Scp complex subunit ScpB [Thermoanaerobaculia bacterium]